MRFFFTRCRLFWSILALLFFLRFWLILGAASPWVGTKFSRLWCCLLRRWFSVNSFCLSWFSRSDFWGSNIYAPFHSSRRVPWFVDFVLSLPFLLCSFISLQLSSLLAFLVAISFTMFPNPSLDSDFLCVCCVGLNGCFWC